MTELLSKLRIRRGFNVEKHTALKLQTINNFFREEGLNAAVLGISGGIDSAVVLGLLINASQLPDSPIKIIQGLNLPIYGNGGTGQDTATDRAELLFDMYRHLPVFIHNTSDLTQAFKGFKQVSDFASDFAYGQLLSVVRTPYLYFKAAMLQDDGFKSIVVGTTNRDEGGYIGFYGKASDGMVDLQPIADFHKSEVYAIAEFLGLPQAIINEKPKGDVYDGRNDEQMIGASYDEVELFTLMKDYNQSWDFPQHSPILKAFQNIIALHKVNEHKYKVGLPSRFVDVLPRAVNGGWK